MSRTFESAKQAIGYAVAVQTHAAGAASRRDSAPGPAPDPWLASSVFACFARAGLDPHDAGCPVLRGVLEWATHADDHAEDAETASKVGSAIRRITVELVEAGIVDPDRPTLERVGWRAIRLAGKVRYVSTTHMDAGTVEDREQLRREVEAGQRSPVDVVGVQSDEQLRKAARDADLEALRALYDAGWIDEHGVDLLLGKWWGVRPRTARRHRTAAGMVARRGPKPSTRGHGSVDDGVLATQSLDRQGELRP